MVIHNSVSSLHNYVNEWPGYRILIPERICSFYFLSLPHKSLKHKIHYIASHFQLPQRNLALNIFFCCNSSCLKPGRFTTERGLHIHYGKSLHCGAHAAACQAYIRHNNTIPSQPSLSQPWDIADDETSVALVAISSVPPSNSKVVEKTKRQSPSQDKPIWHQVHSGTVKQD
jgi:hypothetical protein